MNRIFKTLLAVTVALVMSFSIAVFAGCEDSDKKDKNKVTVPAGTIEKITDTDFAAVNVEANVDLSDEGSFGLNAKVNLSGTADIKIETLGQGDNKGQDLYQYVFLRDWKVYASASDTEIKDFTSAELEGVVDIKQALGAVKDVIPEEIELPADLLGSLELDKLLKEAVGLYNYNILSLANATDAVSVSDGVLTVDFNKSYYTYIKDVKNVLNGLKGTTTVEEILNNETVKKYAMLYTEFITPDELVSLIDELLDGVAGSADVPEEVTAITGTVKELFTKVKPDKNSTTYDYLVKILSSQELVDLINGVSGLPEGFGLNQKLTEFTLNGIYSLASGGLNSDIEPALAQVRQAVETATANVTDKEFKIVDEIGSYISITDAKVIFNYGADGLTSQKVEAKVVSGNTQFGIPHARLMVIDATLTYSKTAYAASEFATLPAVLPEIEDVEIPDIGNPEIPDTDNTIAGKTLLIDEVEITCTDGGEYNGELHGYEDPTQTMVFGYDGSYTIYVGGRAVIQGKYVQEGNVVYYLDKNGGVSESALFKYIIYEDGYWYESAEMGRYIINNRWVEIDL